MVAIDPKIIPFGSLIYSPENERFYLACNIGGAVSSRVAAKKLADKKDLSDKFREALVLDFYAKKEIIDNHFGDFFVILHEGEDFRFDLSKSEQEIRLKPEFWIDRIHKILKESSTKKDTLTAILCRLQEM